MQQNNSAFKIKYGAVSGGPGLEDLEEINQFKESLSASYTTLVKPVLQERGGEAYQFIVDWFSNHSFKDYFEIIGGYLAGKTLDKITDPLIDSYLFNPFKKAYKKLMDKNKGRLGISSFSLDFSDTQVSISSFSPESIFENLDFILVNLYALCQLLKQNDRLPLIIHIPIVKEIISDEVIYRYPVEKDVLLFHRTKRNLYTELWGLFYHLPEKYIIFDLQKQTLQEIISFKYSGSA